MAPLDEVVAQNQVGRKAVLQRLLKCIHIIDALADKGALAEQVLVHIRDRAGVRVDAALPAEQAEYGSGTRWSVLTRRGWRMP